jgi:hypothetical protein
METDGARRYWQFLFYLFIGLLVGEVVISKLTPFYPFYSTLIGYLGLSIEATLPLPQAYANYQTRSAKGLRLSVLGSWLAGDAMKMYWFFTTSAEIPLAFKVCGMFQAACDALVGAQYFWYRQVDDYSVQPGYAMAEATWTVPSQSVHHSQSRSPSPARRRSNTVSDAEKEY